ncbi:tetratricopeptide repeat protein [Streptomyces sp. NBC_01685]|uniref:AfsR/SARP family transcriptional regulator n=1 Tax=Streptomyces sp. NBC_01685 TaxID=2975910 RepID=UPI002E336A0F|nr:BTAD domain-containing putative transcriptional regulator [Streptomyces sp. NBC_01685]
MEMNLGTPKRRGLLALLLVHAGHPVAVQDIVDVLWGQDPPDRAVNVVQRHIGVLRRLLEPGLQVGSNSRWLVRGSGGYRLEVETDALDLLRFRALRRRAGAVAENGDAGQATKLMIEAMALWRGPAALGITSETRSHPVFTAVDQEHLAAVKEAAEYAQGAGADLGARVLAPLRQAAAQYPLDEALHAWLIELLAATGRQAEALDVHRTVRTRLADDLGVDPGPQLTDAQQSVLRRSANRRDTSSSGHGGSAVPDEGKEADQPEGTIPRTPIAVRPAQLPAELSVFTGRDAELDRFQRLLPAAGDCPSTLVISVIGGMAGVGKTTLAIHWAHQVADRFPDGQLFVNLRGFHPADSAMHPSEAARSLLEGLGVLARDIPADIEAASSLYRSLLAGRRVLIVLDNARDAEQIRPLLPGAPGSLVIVTSRNQLYGLVASEGAHAVMLDLLSHEEALRFLSRRLGADRVMGAARAATEITTLCGRLPLALAIVSARAILNPAHSLESIAAALREAHGGLDGFAVEPPLADARSAFSWSYHALTPSAARMFRLVSPHAGSECPIEAVASLVGEEVHQVRAPLAELVRAHLLTETVPGQFGCHELLRAYGTELGRGDGEEAAAARHRMLDHYLHSAYAADSALAPSRERIDLRAPSPGVTVMRFADQSAAADWLDANRTVLLSLIDQDARNGTGGHAWQMAVTLELYLDRSGCRSDQLAAQTAAVSAAQRLRDTLGLAHAHRTLGFVHGRLEHWDEAGSHLTRALELFAGLGDQAGEGRVRRYQAFLANRRGRNQEALEHYAVADALYRSAGHRNGEASISNEVGWTYILMGRYDEALDECGWALAVHRKTGDHNGQAAAWDSLGYAYHQLREYECALICYERALELYRAMRDRYLEADTLRHMGDTHQVVGRPAGAAHFWRQALRILAGMGHPEAAIVRGKLEKLVPADGMLLGV